MAGRIRQERASIGVVLVAALTYGCSASSNPELPRPPSDGGGGTGGNGGNGGRDSGSPDGNGGDDAGDSGVVGPLLPVRLGLVPTAGSMSDAGPTVGDHTQATLDVLAAGSRAVTLARRWSDLFIDATTPRSEPWSFLSKSAPLYRDADRAIAFSLVAVDRTTDARPSGLSGGWDAPATLAAVEALVDKTYATFGSELAYVSIGTEVDRFLESASPADRAAFVTFAVHAMDYARQHPNRPADTQVGVSASAGGIVAESTTQLLELLRASDAVIATYFPLEASFDAKPPAGVAADLDDLVVAVSSDAGTREVVLEQVGYPSADGASSSAENQAAFFDVFFQTLSSRRDRFPFVSIYALNDPAPSICEREAAALGAAGDAVAIAARCSMGVREHDGTTKAAWMPVLDGIATFASP